MKYFTEVVIMKQLGDEGVLTEQQVAAGIKQFHPGQVTFKDKEGALAWLLKQGVIEQAVALKHNATIPSEDEGVMGVSRIEPVDLTLLNWAPTLEDLYTANVEKLQMMLHDGQVDEAQYRAIEAKLKPLNYAINFEDECLNLIQDSDTEEAQMVLSQTTALQLFALHQNKVIGDEDYFYAYQIMVHESQSAQGVPEFEDTKACYFWLVDQGWLDHSFTDMVQAIHFTHNHKLLKQLVGQGVNDKSYPIVLKKLKASSIDRFHDEKALLAWVIDKDLLVEEAIAPLGPTLIFLCQLVVMLFLIWKVIMIFFV